MTPWLTLLGLFWACNESKDTAEVEDTAQEEVEEEVEEEEQEEVDPDSSATVLDLSPGVNEITVEQEVEGEIVERLFLVHVSRDYDGTGSTPYLDFTGAGGVKSLYWTVCRCHRRW